MEINELYEMQRKLDDTIVENFFDRNSKGNVDAKKLTGLIDHYRYTGFLTERITALQVEVSELANETRCFKYWSTRQNQYDREKALKEYVDIFHFFLSIGNTLNFSPEEIVQAYKEKNEENYNRQLIGY